MNPSVLIVDDEATFLDSARRKLRMAGYAEVTIEPDPVKHRDLLRSLRHEATASGRVTRRASSDPSCIGSRNDIGSPSGKALSGRRGSLCTSGVTCPMCGGTASTTS